MSHTVKKKNCMTDMTLLAECCEELDVEMFTGDTLSTGTHLCIRGGVDTALAVLKIPGWYSTVTIQPDEILYDGDNRSERIDKLTKLRKLYAEKVVGRAAQSMRSRVKSERVTHNGRAGTMYTLTVGRTSGRIGAR